MRSFYYELDSHSVMPLCISDAVFIFLYCYYDTLILRLERETSMWTIHFNHSFGSHYFRIKLSFTSGVEDHCPGLILILSRRPLGMNFSNYQNRLKLIVRKFWGIDLYAILKPSAKFKRNWFTSFEIWKNMKKFLLKIQCIVIFYTKFYENSRIRGWNIKQNCYEISEKLVRCFFAIKYKFNKTSYE